MYDKMNLESPVKLSDWKRFVKETPLAIIVLLVWMFVARFIVLAIINWVSS
jgi:hypothetical protein